MIEHARLFAELNWKSNELLRSHRFLEKNSRQLALSEKRLRKNLALVERANIELARVDRMKNHFLGMISHEFKTPLTAIICSADFLMAYSGREMADDARRLLEIIQKGGVRLNQIISDLLKVARIEANASPDGNTTINIEEMLNDLQQQFAPLFQSRNQRLTFQGIDAMPNFIGDRECLYDIFTRLLENAVKFTPDGGDLVIAAEVTNRQGLKGKREILAPFNPSFCEQPGNSAFLQVEFRDSGVGIPPEERHNIFDIFYELGDIRHHSSGREKFLGKGAGLGLAIVKGVIEAHGGMVWVESPVFDSADRPGSSFFVLVPLEGGPSQAVFSFMRTEPASAARGLTDLADDESDEPA
jgi:signal transduction histidine kinase